jgi:hypothetical protein
MLALALAGWIEACAAELDRAAQSLAPGFTVFERARITKDAGSVQFRVQARPWIFGVLVRDAAGEPRGWHTMQRRSKLGWTDLHKRRTDGREAHVWASWQPPDERARGVEDRFQAFAAAFKPAADRCLEAK